MLEKLLEFLLHAKAGAISGVLLIGAGGALVSATTQDGVTTITIQQASPSPSVSASPSPSASPTPSPSPTPAPSPSATPTPSSSPSSAAKPKDSCDDEAHERNEARKTAHAAFVKFHKLLEDLKHEVRGKDPRAAREMLKAADKLIHEIDETAKKAIHEATRCRDDHDDEDEDRDERKDREEEDEDRDEDRDDEDDEGSNDPLRSDADARAIAEQAAKAMETVYELARSRLAELNLAATTKKPEQKKTDKRVTPKPSAKPTFKPAPKPTATPSPKPTEKPDRD